MLCDVNREAEISAAIEAGLLSIDEHGRFVIDRAEIQQHILALPVARDLEVSAEPGVVCIFPLDPCARPLARGLPPLGLARDRDNHTGQATFQTGWNQDLVFQRLPKGWFFYRVYRRRAFILPNAVQVLPRAALQLRPRILRPRVGSHLLRPRSIQRRCLDGILGGAAGDVVVLLYR